MAPQLLVLACQCQCPRTRVRVHVHVHVGVLVSSPAQPSTEIGAFQVERRSAVDCHFRRLTSCSAAAVGYCCVAGGRQGTPARREMRRRSAASNGPYADRALTPRTFVRRLAEMSRERCSTVPAPAGAIPSLFAFWASWCSLTGDEQLGFGSVETTVGFSLPAWKGLWALLANLAVPSGGSRWRVTTLAVLVVECSETVVKDVGRIFAG